jgi:hexokinase
MEKIDKIIKLNGEINPAEDKMPDEVSAGRSVLMYRATIYQIFKMCVNTEWGGFGDDGAMDFARTKYDKVQDENSINVGQQL